MELQEKIDTLRDAGFPVRHAYREDAEQFGYLSWSDPIDYETEDTEPYVDLGSVARGEDGADQTGTVERSNYRGLRRDHPDMFTDVSYSNVNSLGAFVNDLTEDMIGTLVGLVEQYPLYDESDHSYLEHEEITASWDEYLSMDMPGEIEDRRGEWVRQAWDEMTADAQRDMFWSVVDALDIYPEHDGLDVRWSMHMDAITGEIHKRIGPSWSVRCMMKAREDLRYETYLRRRDETRARLRAGRVV